MLRIMDRGYTHNCQGYTRREILRIGALGWGGLSLADLLRARAEAASGGRVVQDKAVVFLFLQGGPSHLETFDPKMTAPAEIRSIFGEVQTRLPGITFGSHFPRLAMLADRFTVVRSYGSGNTNHTYQEVASGGNPLEATLGALYARVAGPNNPATGMPNNILVLPEAVAPDLKMGSNFETSALPTLTHPGQLGPNYGAFNPAGGGQVKENMELKLPRERLDDRRFLLNSLDGLRRQAEAGDLLKGVDHYQQQAFEIITGGVADAFDLSRESPRTLARYETSHLFRNEEPQKYYDMKRASNQLGKQMLLARRMCEAGCGFVTVSDCGWDMHSNRNSPKGLGGMKWLGPQVDHAVSAFLEDVEERGLSEKILLVVTGEMGRTPRINNHGGRDHYGELTPLLFAGGGLKMGQVIGQSDSHATKALTEPYRPEHMLVTILQTLFDFGELRVTRGVPRDLIRIVNNGQPIRELV